MRAAAALLGAVALAAVVVAWRMAVLAVEEQAKLDAASLISAAQNVLSLREDKKLETLARVAAELGPKNVFAAESLERLPELVRSTSFGESLNSAVLVHRTGELIWAAGKPAGGKVQLEVISTALLGASGMAMLQSNDAALAVMKHEGYEVPLLVAAAPVAGGSPRDIAGAVVVIEPVAPDFFQHLAQLTRVRVAFATSDGDVGIVPKGAMGVDRQLTYVESVDPPVLAQRIDFHIRGVKVGEVVAAVDAASVTRRTRGLAVYFAAAAAVVVAVTLLSVRRRS